MRVIRAKKPKLGDYKMRCDRSGHVFPASEMRKEWTGMWVHQDYWEPRHPQDFVRGRADNQRVPVARPDPSNISLLKSASGSGTTSDATITLVTADIGSEKNCSRMVLSILMTSYDANRSNLFLSYSSDDATYTDLADVPTKDALSSSIENTAFSLPVSENTRYWRLQLRNNSGSVTHSSTMDIYGSDVANVSVGDL